MKELFAKFETLVGAKINWISSSVSMFVFWFRDLWRHLLKIHRIIRLRWSDTEFDMKAKFNVVEKIQALILKIISSGLETTSRIIEDPRSLFMSSRGSFDSPSFLGAVWYFNPSLLDLHTHCLWFILLISPWCHKRSQNDYYWKYSIHD